MRKDRFVLVLVTIALSNMDAAVISTFSSLASFTTALGSAPIVTENFESLAPGTNLLGAAILPGMTASTSMPILGVFSNVLSNTLFAQSSGAFVPRTNPAYILTGGGYTALGFDIEAWNPEAPGTLDLLIQFADGDLRVINLTRPVGALEEDPQFFGVISSSSILSLQLNEPLETDINNNVCCEEVAMDDFIAANPVPEPSTVILASTAMALIFIGRRLSLR